MRCSRELCVLEIHKWCKWIDLMWEISQELYVLDILYRSKIEPPDTVQRNGIINSEAEICMWKYFVILFGSGFPCR